MTGAASSPFSNADEVPLLCGQRWLLRLFLHQRAWARPVQRLYRLPPALDTRALLEAVRTVVSRHPALRLQLVETARGWRQRFLDVDADVSGIALRDRSRRERAAYASHVLAADGAEPFDLRHQLPFRLTIVEVDGEYFLSVCLDHLAADETGFDLFEWEVADAYRCAMLGSTPPDWPAAAAFRRCLEREIEQREHEREHTGYWRRQLQGAPSGHPNAPHGDVDWVPGASHRWSVSGIALRELIETCRRERYSLFVAVLSAQVRLLAGLLHTDDIVLNVPVSNRGQADDRRVIANLSMLLHVRFGLSAAQSDREFVHQVRDRMLAAIAHRQYDYGSLSDTIGEDAAARGRRIHWLMGCSYLDDRLPPMPDPVLAERLDEDSTPLDVPRTACTFAYRHRGDRLEVTATWDPDAWKVDGAAFAHGFLDVLGALHGQPALGWPSSAR